MSFRIYQRGKSLKFDKRSSSGLLVRVFVGRNAAGPELESTILPASVFKESPSALILENYYLNFIFPTSAEHPA